MLARFYGIYNVKIKYMKQISVVIMDNLMSEHVNEILAVYDLKGSTHKRITLKPKKVLSVRKDLNFLPQGGPMATVRLVSSDWGSQRKVNDILAISENRYFLPPPSRQEIKRSCGAVVDWSSIAVVTSQSGLV